jgi:uncharacterized protein (TIGR02452 family)
MNFQQYNPNFFPTEKPRNIYIERIDCWNDTQELSKRIEQPPKSIKFKHNSELNMEKKYSNTPIIISNLDTIECAILLKNQNYNPLVLNLGDPHHSGGCVEMASKAQEESLFRTTNLCMTLKTTNDLYPIRDDEALLSNKIKILKTTEQSGWKLIKENIFFDFITCCGIINPKIDYTNEKKPKPKPKPKFKLETDIEKLIKKIELILQVAYINGNDSLVLGSLGCGSFKSPSNHTAKIFKAVLKKYDGIFKIIHFAILKGVDSENTMTKDHNKLPEDNFDIFKEVFDN